MVMMINEWLVYIELQQINSPHLSPVVLHWTVCFDGEFRLEDQSLAGAEEDGTGGGHRLILVVEGDRRHLVILEAIDFLGPLLRPVQVHQLGSELRGFGREGD